MKVGFIGAGNMASAMIGGIINSKLLSPSNIIASAKTTSQSNCFFTKEATGISNTKCTYFNDSKAEDLVPQLTITYSVLNAINDITVETKADGAVYNLAGQRVNNPQHGIYVKNGRKYIVK